MKQFLLTLLLLAMLFILTSCAHQPSGYHHEAPGFFSGVLHGFIAPFTLIISIFRDIRIYNYPNSGFWYDAGFVVGFLMISGGGGASAGSRRR
jgi:hypothetical protein